MYGLYILYGHIYIIIDYYIRYMKPMLVNPYGNVDQSGWVLVYSIKGGGLVLKSIWVTTDLINTIGRKLWNLHEI